MGMGLGVYVTKTGVNVEEMRDVLDVVIQQIDEINDRRVCYIDVRMMKPDQVLIDYEGSYSGACHIQNLVCDWAMWTATDSAPIKLRATNYEGEGWRETYPKKGKHNVSR